MLRRIIAAASVAVLLAACTQSGDSDQAEPSTSPSGPPAASDPVIAFTRPSNDVISTSRILAKSKTLDVGGLVHDFLPNGSVLVDRYLGGDIDKPSYPVIVDPATGSETEGRKAYNADSGVVGFGRDSLLVVTDDGKKHKLQEFGLDFAKKREIALPGRSGVGDPDVGRATVYGNAVDGDGAVFITTSEWKGVESVADSVTRVDSDGNLTTLLKNKHVDQIKLATDGKTLLASMAEDGPYYEGGAPLKDIVELDASSGKLVRSYGIPDPCTSFEPLFDDASCLDELDKVGGVVAVTVYESAKPAEDLDAYSTWRYTDGAWSEVKSQRNRRVVWQSHSTRIQQHVELGVTIEDPNKYPLEWVVGDKVSKIPGTSNLTAFDWHAPGSLIRP